MKDAATAIHMPRVLTRYDEDPELLCACAPAAVPLELDADDVEVAVGSAAIVIVVLAAFVGAAWTVAIYIYIVELRPCHAVNESLRTL